MVSFFFTNTNEKNNETHGGNYAEHTPLKLRYTNPPVSARISVWLGGQTVNNLKGDRNEKMICLLCCVLNILIITSCNSATEMGPVVTNVNVSQETPNTENKNVENEEIRESVSEINIVDTRLSGRLWSASHDYFYSDEDYLYYLPAYPMHEYIIVEYSDGTSQNIAEALASGNVTMEDLDVFNIEYGKQLKSEVEERINNEEKCAS